MLMGNFSRSLLLRKGEQHMVVGQDPSLAVFETVGWGPAPPTAEN
jgi:hypothetical protein